MSSPAEKRPSSLQCFGVKRWIFTDATYRFGSKTTRSDTNVAVLWPFGVNKAACRCQWRGIDPQTLLVPINLPLTVKTNSICVLGPFTVKWVQLSGFLEIWMCDIRYLANSTLLHLIQKILFFIWFKFT